MTSSRKSKLQALGLLETGATGVLTGYTFQTTFNILVPQVRVETVFKPLASG